jgi:hypothetical protein
MEYLEKRRTSRCISLTELKEIVNLAEERLGSIVLPTTKEESIKENNI